MANIYYKLPLDEDVDKDILKWIEELPRMKKGEVIRHALRYYMAETGQGEETIKFPNSISPVQHIPKEKPMSQAEENKAQRRAPAINRSAMKGINQ